ncbi:MAG: hypothetical protein HZA53_03560 [Planctomycetes bacterium]|nr:hypothetical protein [Planctomycetota bacterium]
MKLLAALLLLAACAPTVPPQVSEFVDQAIERATQQDFTPESGAGAAGGVRELFHADDVAQGVQFERGDHEFVLETLALDARTGRYERSRARIAADGAIEAVAARRAWELFVATRAEDGEVAIHCVRVLPKLATDEDTPARCARAALLRTRELDGVRLLACDPEGRYLLALGGDGERLLQIPIQRGATGYFALGADRLPTLRTACGLFFGKHVQRGVVWAFESCGEQGLDRAVLVDRDEEGSFDEVLNLDAREWAESAYQGSTWTEQSFVAAR